MDFASEESYIFDPLQVDSSFIPIVNFSEYDEYPKRYINTQNPLGKKNEFVNMDNTEVKDIRNKLGLPAFSRNIRDSYDAEKIAQNIEKPTANVSRDNVITRTATEGFSSLTNLVNNKPFFHLFLIIFIVLFVILITQAFTMYTQNKLLKSMIKYVKTKN